MLLKSKPCGVLAEKTKVSVRRLFTKTTTSLANITANRMFQSKIFPKSPKLSQSALALLAGFRDSATSIARLKF